MRKTNQRIGFTLMAVAWLLGLPVMAAGGPPAIRWAGLNLLARVKICEGLGFCVDPINEFDWGCELDQCAKPLRTYGGAAKEIIPRLRETIVATRKAIEAEPWNGETWNKDIVTIEKLIKTLESDKKPATVVSIGEFTGKKEHP